MNRHFAITALSSLAFLTVMTAEHGWAAGKKRHQASDPSAPIQAHTGKRVIEFGNIENAVILMPNDLAYSFDLSFRHRIQSHLTNTGRFLVAEPISPRLSKDTSSKVSEPDFVWPGTIAPSAHLSIQVNAMSFTTGSRGTRIIYGFDEFTKSKFNSDLNEIKNEFPMRTGNDSILNWFDHTFDPEGDDPGGGSLTGLDLGEGLTLDVLFAFLKAKYAAYSSKLKFSIKLTSPYTGLNEEHIVETNTKGFYFDVVGSYAGYMVGIQAARKDALERAFKKGIESTLGVFDRVLADIPLVAVLDGIVLEGEQKLYLLGTGHDAQIPAGTSYRSIECPDSRVKVTRSNSSGSLAVLESDSLGCLKPGKVLVQSSVEPIKGTESLKLASAQLASNETIQTEDTNHAPPPELTIHFHLFDRIEAFMRQLAGIPMLPYRLYRYFAYNQKFGQFPMHDIVPMPNSAHSRAKDVNEWSREADGAWVKQIGLDQVGEMGDSQVTIAIVDSGVDYNHPILKKNIARDRNGNPGYDFYSGDARPFDDHFHGTEVASLVLKVAPKARLLPVKVFDPWGHTTSAALEAGIRYAVDQGAQIILCAWATHVSSVALIEAVEYATSKNVIVVASAGDMGDHLDRFEMLPATLKDTSGLLVTVGGIQSTGNAPLVRGKNKSGHGPKSVSIAAPSDSILVARPRGQFGRKSSTDYAAALVSGAIARKLALNAHHQNDSVSDLVQSIYEDSHRVTSLERYFKEGRTLLLRD